jgi:hypothetical protein
MKVFFVYHTVNSYSNNIDKRTYSIFWLLSLVQVDVKVFGRMEYVGYIGRFEEILVNQRYGRGDGMRLVQSQWDLSEYRLCYFSRLVVASFTAVPLLVTSPFPCTHRSSCTRWFKYDRDYLCVNKSQFVPVIFEPPCILFQIHGTSAVSKPAALCITCSWLLRTFTSYPFSHFPEWSFYNTMIKTWLRHLPVFLVLYNVTVYILQNIGSPDNN